MSTFCPGMSVRVCPDIWILKTSVRCWTWSRRKYSTDNVAINYNLSHSVRKPNSKFMSLVDESNSLYPHIDEVKIPPQSRRRTPRNSLVSLRPRGRRKDEPSPSQRSQFQHASAHRLSAHGIGSAKTLFSRICDLHSPLGKQRDQKGLAGYVSPGVLLHAYWRTQYLDQFLTQKHSTRGACLAMKY